MAISISDRFQRVHSGNILAAQTSTDEQHPFELLQEATETCERLQRRFEEMDENCKRLRNCQQHIDSLMEEIRSHCENVKKSREKLQQCTGILEPGALCLSQENTKQLQAVSAQVEKAEQQDRMKVLLEKQEEKRAFSDTLLQTQGELSQACQQIQQLRQEEREQQEKRQTVDAKLQAELQEAQSEIQATQKRHKEDFQGVKEEMNVLLEQREALQKQVEELTCQLVASRKSQETIVWRAQQDVREAQELSKQKVLEVKQIQKMLEEAEDQNKVLQGHLQNLEKEWSQWEDVARQSSERQTSLNALEREKARLILSLEEKNSCLRMLEEKNLALNNQVCDLHRALHQAELLDSEHQKQLRELNTQIRALHEALLEKQAAQATREKQLLEELEESRAGEQWWRDSVHMLEAEVSELRVRLQSSEDKAFSLAMQCKALELELKNTQAQRDNLRACNQELQTELEESEQVMWRAEHKVTCLEIALKEEATALKEEAVTLRQEVASLQRKLENLEKERKDVLVERELYQEQTINVEIKDEISAPNVETEKERTQQLEVESEAMREELEHGAAALKEWRGKAQVLSAALSKSEISKGALKKHLEVLKGKACLQAVGAEGNRLLEKSKKSVECVQHLVSTPSKDKKEKSESTAEARRAGEQVQREERSVKRIFRTFEISDTIGLDVPQSAQHSRLTSGQAVGAEGNRLLEKSKKSVECVQHLVSTSSNDTKEKSESTTEARRAGEQEEPEGSRIGSFKRVFPTDYFTLPVSQSTSESGESSSSSGKQQPSF